MVPSPVLNDSRFVPAGGIAEVKTEIKNKIRRLRFDHEEMTQQALANGVGVTRQTIIAIEAGKYAPSLELAFRIARFFDAGVEDVFEYDDSRTPAQGE